LLAFFSEKGHIGVMKIEIKKLVEEGEHEHEMVVCDVCLEWATSPELCECGLVVCKRCVDWKLSHTKGAITCERCARKDEREAA
jgi:hypothetical protein